MRETFPDRVLEDADEVVLVDLTPEALQERLRAGKVYPRDRAEVALQNFFRADKLSALRELALREVAEDVGHRRQAVVLDSLSHQAVSERVLALVEPQPKSQRIMRRAWRSAERLGAQMDAIWVRPRGHVPSDAERRRSRRSAGSRSCSVRTSSKRRGTTWWRPSSASSYERGTTYVIVGTPDESRRREIMRGSLLSALVRELPGVDIRVVANRADRPRPHRDGLDAGLVAALAALGAALAASLLACRRPRRRAIRPGARRILVAFEGRLDPTVLDAAIRIARAEDAVLVPAYLLIVPLRYAEDSPLKEQVEVAMPLLEAVEHAALRGGVPVDARIEKGRTLTHALRRLWEVERFDRIIAPAGGSGGFNEKELAWLLTHAPAETLVLKPMPDAA